MRKMSIRKKVSSLTVRIALISLVIIGVITISGLWVLRNNTVNISGDLGDTAAGDSQMALEEQMTGRLVTLAENMAALGDASLRNVQNSVEMIAQNAGEIARNPERFPAEPRLAAGRFQRGYYDGAVSNG